MSVLSERERDGCRVLLSLLSPEDQLSLCDTVTNRLITVESHREAIEAIITYSQSPEELLKRRRIHREIIFKYLAREGVAVPPNIEKHQLVKRTLELWSSGNNTLNVNSAVVSEAPDGLGDLTALGKQFCQWYFNLLNSLNPETGQSGQDWGPQHFWGDVKLQLLTYTGEKQEVSYLGAELVSRRLCALVWEENLVFCPNLEHSGFKCISSPHGLVLVAVAGTIHQKNVCLGIFEQVFGLIRDPLNGNCWKMKYVHLKVMGQIGREQLPVVTYDTNDLLQLFTK
ncbi:uncharacterized protein C3orf38 homolog [Hoplias malabaricus]|uniref:uncharacterized protein C3orf38 homolog n=1 Tax=Hoplias malabaricus TaxID=27720 RepID=UPI003463187D